MVVRRRLVLAALLAAPAHEAAADDPWQAAREGRAAILLRHAIAPGTGDPPGFRLGDCASQRTLSEAGRAQARAIGAALRARGIASAHVFSSAWCRAHETAALLGFGPVRHAQALDSFFADRAAAPERTAALRRLLAGWTGPAALVLVTHQVNITALTGVFPASGEALLVYTGERAGAVALRVPPPSP
jgi:broad specificity phosphatase PhoE